MDRSNYSIMNSRPGSGVNTEWTVVSVESQCSATSARDDIVIVIDSNVDDSFAGIGLTLPLVSNARASLASGKE